jgi:hypothetical protein
MTMDCDSVRNVLDAHAADALNGPLRDDVNAHLNVCTTCRAEYAQTRKLVQLLRTVEMPEPSADFADRLLRSATRLARRQRLRRITGLATAAVLTLGIAIGALVEHGLVSAPDAAGYDSEVSIAAGTVSTVALEVNAGHPLQGVEFVLNIPEGFDLKGHEGKRSVAWTGDLYQGHNRLKLHLIGRQGSSGILVASLRHDGKQKIFKLNLRADQESPGAVPSSTDSRSDGI